jgi:hypothetical protein
MKTHKTGADEGLVAEMIKLGHQPFLRCIAHLFNDLLKGTTTPPATWRTTKLKVLFKKGDPSLPQNYRPISIIPVMAKLFSVVLYGRIVQDIDDRLSEEQFGFRRGRGCSDAVHTLRMLVEKSAEWGQPLWIAALDVEKAFDRVHHSSLFAALLDTGIDVSIVSALRALYWQMSGFVVLWQGAESRSFALQRGVRQGDPLSPLLFNLVLDGALREVCATWRCRKYGTLVGEGLRGQRITHVAFADDQTLIAHSWLTMKRMLLTLKSALEKRGLTLHPSKCKLQTNDEDWVQRGSVSIAEGFAVEILPEGEPLTILGTELHLCDATGHEVYHRIAVGWHKFWSLKRLLLDSKASLKKRLKLFDSTVANSVLWCTESWTPRSAELGALQSAQRSMLRRICRTSRRDDETWVEWLGRATHTRHSENPEMQE